MAVLPYTNCCWVILFCIAFTCGQPAEDAECTLKIAAFNIQNLGTKKMGNEEVVKVIKKIIPRYDVVLVQELVDKTETIIYELLKQINSELDDKLKYNVTVGPRVGRTWSKEQYAYFYRISKLKVVEAYSYHDASDTFEREPYVVILSPTCGSKTLDQFALVGIHTKPTDAVAELQHLDVVADSIVKKGTKNVMMMGDFNADCDYVRKKNWPTITLWTSSKYVWLIGNEVDTTATASDCAYDRFVVTADSMNRYIVQGSAAPFTFDKEYGLDKDAATAVSDHYPIEVTINAAAKNQERRSLS